jgi:enoyl-CoA hydratase
MLIHTWTEDGILWLEIHRPDRLNALNREALLELRAVLLPLAEDSDARVVLLTGAGDRAFCAGADIAEMDQEDEEGIRSLMGLGKEVTLLLEEAPQPVLAVVNGYALGGGCELALACDLVLASERAQFGLPEIDLALLPGWGGSQRVERRVGYGRARDMVLTGRRVPAQEALAWGLCDRVFPVETLRSETTALAKILAGKDQAALAGAKRALRRRSELPLTESLLYETELFVRLFIRPERTEAMGRFLKRG